MSSEDHMSENALPSNNAQEEIYLESPNVSHPTAEPRPLSNFSEQWIPVWTSPFSARLMMLANKKQISQTLQTNPSLRRGGKDLGTNLALVRSLRRLKACLILPMSPNYMIPDLIGSGLIQIRWRNCSIVQGLIGSLIGLNQYRGL